jgi:hypothetical protein
VPALARLFWPRAQLLLGAFSLEERNSRNILKPKLAKNASNDRLRATRRRSRLRRDHDCVRAEGVSTTRAPTRWRRRSQTREMKNLNSRQSAVADGDC